MIARLGLIDENIGRMHCFTATNMIIDVKNDTFDKSYILKFCPDAIKSTKARNAFMLKLCFGVVTWIPLFYKKNLARI